MNIVQGFVSINFNSHLIDPIMKDVNKFYLIFYLMQTFYYK